MNLICQPIQTQEENHATTFPVTTMTPAITTIVSSNLSESSDKPRPDDTNNHASLLDLDDDVIIIDEVEWTDTSNPNESSEKAIRPRYSRDDESCGCVPEDSSDDAIRPKCCIDSSCVLYACQEECRSNCHAGVQCGNKRISGKKWKRVCVFDAGLKGKGLRIMEPALASDFIIEYCGVAVQKKLEGLFKRYKMERMLYIMDLAVSKV